MTLKPKLVEGDVVKKLLKYNTTRTDPGVINNTFSYLCKHIVYILRNYADFIFVLLFLFLVLYLRYKYNNNNKKLTGPNEVHVNYIRNKDIVNNQVYNIKDDIVTEDDIDDNILNIIKKEINNLDDDNIEPVSLDTYQNYSSY
jgi:hypothetical protein